MGAEESKVESIFYAALEKNSAVERAAYLDEACSDDSELRDRVELLLDAQPNLGRFLENDAVGAPPFDQPLAEQPGTVIGPYKLIEEIGEGGMGSVFMALQKEPVRRKVALKVIKPGMDSRQVVSRFEAERQTLAMMDHPNIAKVHDGGATESGRPYFVMELVNGMPITGYCDRYRLTTNDRLELFSEVCRAVQHAHQKGIIHRDLKPSNILVTLLDGRAIPKVIDFGIAKATRGHLTEESLVTHFAQMIGSPLYMSPEQAQLSAADVDTRSDVYSLGVLLYELLTGNTPFDRERMSSVSFDEFRRIIREEEPPRPSTCLSTLDAALDTVADKHHTDPRTLSHEVAGELDWIVMKALEKDRTRRYETASDLAKDVRRYLDDEAIEACPPSKVYRFGKFFRRNKARLATIATCIALLVVAIVGASTVAWNRHRQKTELARAVNKELDDAQQSLEAGDLAAAERKLTAARTRLDAARYDVEHLQTDVARLSKEVSAKTLAQKRFDEFEQIRERVFSRIYDLHKQEMQQAAKDCQTALDLFNIFGPGDWKRQPGYRNLHEQRQQRLEEHVVELMFVMARLEVWTVTPDAWTILDEEDRRVVVDAAAHQRAINVLRRIETVSRPTAGVYAFLSQCWRELGRMGEVQKTNATGKKLRPTTALDYYILGELLAKRGSREKALERYGQALGRDPTHYLSLLAMGDTLEKLRQLQAAEMALTGAITANPRPTFSYIKRALIRLRQDKRDLALADFAEAASRDPTLAEDYFDRGHWNLENGEPEQALSDWTAAIGLDPKNATAYFHRGLLYAKHQGKLEKAIADFSRTIQLDPGQAEAYYSRGIAYHNQGKFDRAAADFGAALTRGLTRPEVYTRRGTAHALSGSAQLALDDYGEALRLDPYYTPAFFERGIVLCDCLGEFERAIADFDAAIRINPKQPLACYNRAVACAAKGDLEGALAGWTEAIWLDPRFARAYFERGILYCNGLDEFGKAVADFNQVLRLAPELLIAYYNRGIACYNRGDRGQALASWTRAIGLGFTRVEVYCSRGILYARRGELQKAIVDFDEAIRIDPQYAPAYNHRAAARAALGQAQKAADDRAEAVRLLEIQRKTTPNNKAAGEVSLTTTPLTGQASPRRLVCASEEMMSCILLRTGSLLESRTMFFLPLLRKLSQPVAMRTGQAHLRHFPRLLQPRRLRHEPLEARHLLSAVSGTVFEDLDADGVRDTGEAGLEGWTMALEDVGISSPLLTIPNPSGVAEEAFAFSLASMGNNVLAAAEHADRNGVPRAGVAYLLDGATGEVLQTFENPDPMDNDQFGISLAPLGNDKVVIGTRRDWNTDGVGNYLTGVAYVFDIATGQPEVTILDPNPVSTISNNFSGSIKSIATFGDGFLIGSSPNGTTPETAGVVYHFHADGVLLNTLLNPSLTGNDNFGENIVVMDNEVLVGVRTADTFGENAGAFYLFDGTSGDLLRTFSHPTPEPGDEFGHIVVDGDTILTCAKNDDTDGTDTGIAFAFNRDGQLLQTFHNPTPDFDDGFSRIAINGDKVLIGAVRDDAGATDAGAAHLFDLPTGALLHTYLNPTPEADDRFAVRVYFLANGNVAIGCRHDDVGNVNSGAVYVYDTVATATTDGAGSYNFTGLEDGTYRIWQVSPEGYFQTAPGGDGSDTVIIAGGVPVTGPVFGMAPTTTASYDNSVPKDLKDAKNAARPGVTQSTVTIADAHRIVDLNVDLSITHPRPEDLDVFLIAPDGTTRIELFTDVAGAGGTITLDDEAPWSIVDAPDPYVDAYRPEGSLAAVDGMSTEGTWTLEIADDTKGEVGRLESWSLTIEQVPLPPPPPGPPSIDSLSDNPDPVKQGQSLTLTANGVVDDGEVTSVAFYRDDGDGSFGAGDTLLATDTNGTDGWTATIDIPWDFGTGVYTYFAQATDNEQNLGNVVSTTGEVKRAKPKDRSADASLAADRLFASSALALDFADPLVDDRLFPAFPKKHGMQSAVDLALEDITADTFDEGSWLMT